MSSRAAKPAGPGPRPPWTTKYLLQSTQAAWPDRAGGPVPLHSSFDQAIVSVERGRQVEAGVAPGRARAWTAGDDCSTPTRGHDAPRSRV